MEECLAGPDRRSLTLEDFEVVEPKRVDASLPVPGDGSLDLEDILSEAICETANSSHKIKAEPLVDQVLSIRPEANIQVEAPAELDLFKVIFETEEVSQSGEQPAPAPAEQRSSATGTEDAARAAMSSGALREGQAQNFRMVGGSKFYEVMEEQRADTDADAGAGAGEGAVSPSEKQDCMKPTDSDEEVSDVDQDCTVFSGVSYLGAATISAPKDEADIQRIMGTLSMQKESETGIAVSVSIPVCSQGLVVLYDAGSNSVMARYAVQRISFYARGPAGSALAAYFAFTWSHGDSRASAVYQCHVFRCHIAEAVAQVSGCFARAFERVPRSMTSSVASEGGGAGAASLSWAVMDGVQGAPPMQLMHVLECTVEIKEIDARGTFTPVPKDKMGFKLRGGIDKMVTISVRQVCNEADSPEQSAGRLNLEKCFGILLAPGRNVKHSEMRLLEMVSGEMGASATSLCSMWNAGDEALGAFNVVSPFAAPTYMSLALTFVIRGILDPLRLVIETPVKIVPPTERYWYVTKKPLVQQFFINLKEGSTAAGHLQYEVASVETSGELDRSRLNLPLALSSLLPSPLGSAPPHSPSPPSPPSPTEPALLDSDGDEPLLSGTGEVSKDCCESVLENWATVLRGWTGPRPKALGRLVSLGVPEALRGEVWQRLANIDQYQDLMDTYRLLITKEYPREDVIQRDIARTFPAHDHFREAGGLGQDSLLRVMRAYAVYDEEVEYCQGLSFLAATLLLHMPEEQAFCVLVRLMYGYGIREFYKAGFEALYMRLHQLDRLMEEQLGELRAHFEAMAVESHMFASQWFLTMYTARFPLPLVYHIMDVFLLQGMDTLFQVAIALLARYKKELLQLDFEGILKYFRVTLPKKCRAEETARQIVKAACAVKVKRLHKYQLEFETFTKEASEKEKMNAELERLRHACAQLQQDKELLEDRFAEAHAATRAALLEAERSAAVARDYREICARLDRQLHHVQDVVKECTSCSNKVTPKDNKDGEDAGAEVKGEGGAGCGAAGAESALAVRVRDLELELAQVKLAHVQAQCTNQELTHKLNMTVNEYRAAMKEKLSWPPWLAKTLGSIKEAAQNTKPSFQTYLPTGADLPQPQPQPQPALRRQTSLTNHTRPADGGSRRVSEPAADRADRRKRTSKRHSMQAQGTNKEPQKELNRRSHDVTALLNDGSTG